MDESKLTLQDGCQCDCLQPLKPELGQVARSRLAGELAGTSGHTWPIFDGLDDEQLALAASDVIAEMRADEAAAIRAAGGLEEHEPEPVVEPEARAPSGLAIKGRRWFAARVEGMSDERLARVVGSRVGMAALFRSMARMYRPDKSVGFRGTIQFNIGTPRGDDIWVAVAVVAMLLSLLGPIIAGLTISATVGLLAIHITAGGILIAFLPQGIRPR